jgi:hypothetical protein
MGINRDLTEEEIQVLGHHGYSDPQAYASENLTDEELQFKVDAYNNASADVKRKRDYLPIQEQLDLMYWDKVNNTSKWIEHRNKVKSDNPKPV